MAKARAVVRRFGRCWLASGRRAGSTAGAPPLRSSTAWAASPARSRPPRPRRSATSTRASPSCTPSTTTRRSARSAARASSTRSARWRCGASRSRTGRTSTTRSCPTDRAKAAWDALTQAQALAAGASPVEQALIEALGLALRLPAARGPQAARAGLRRRDAAGLEGLPEGRRRRRALRRVARRPAAVGPVDARRHSRSRAPRSSSRRSRPCSRSTRSTRSPTT